MNPVTAAPRAPRPALIEWTANGRAQPLVLLRRATPADADAVFELLEGYARLGLVLPRTRTHVHGMIDDFLVATDGLDIVGCAALRRYSPLLAEIGGLAVAQQWHGHGIGRLLVEALLDEAVAADMTCVFALTLQPEFFHKLGFRTTDIAAFPEKVARDCGVCAQRHCCIEIAVVRELGPAT